MINIIIITIDAVNNIINNNISNSNSSNVSINSSNNSTNNISSNNSTINISSNSSFDVINVQRDNACAVSNSNLFIWQSITLERFDLSIVYTYSDGIHIS